MKKITIAIDGFSSCGKSTMAKRLAAELGYVYVDTGAMYRAIALYMLKNNVDIHSEETVVSQLENVDIKLEYRDGAQCVILNGEDVSTQIRTNEVSMTASVTSAYKQVRAFLMDTQRNVAKTTSVIMDGRDIGTVVLKDATLKIYLTASAEVRARRRLAELAAKDETLIPEELAQKSIKELTALIRDKKQGKSSCCGGCAGCAMAGHCHPHTVKPADTAENKPEDTAPPIEEVRS